jgi:type II secretory pathway predicted ATPase ExeA
LRLLCSACFDSRQLIAVVLAGDGRLTEKLRRDELQPLGSRIRTRLALERASRDQLSACLDHLLASAGNAALMTPELKHTLCEHALGNYRVMTNLGAELLSAGAQRKLPKLDEKLYLDLFNQTQPSTGARRAPRAR